jgi:catechol 2,3-dioxygenase-like lactoylglutathione lyase family enzyme
VTGPLGSASTITKLPAQDLERARDFYRDKLGLEPVEERIGGLRYVCGPTEFHVFLSAGSPSGRSTQMGFEVEDLEATVADLRARGVTFETFEMPGFEAAGDMISAPDNYPSKGTGELGAFFYDSEGNLIGLAQAVGEGTPQLRVGHDRPLANIVTLGVRDFAAQRDFYRRLGWSQAFDSDDFAVFELRGALLALFPLDKLAADSRTTPGNGRDGIRFSIIISVDHRQEVDEFAERVRAAGGRFTKEPVDADFHDGRSAYFADPEDNYWEIAWIASGGPVVQAAKRAAGLWKWS